MVGEHARELAGDQGIGHQPFGCGRPVPRPARAAGATDSVLLVVQRGCMAIVSVPVPPGVAPDKRCEADQAMTQDVAWLDGRSGGGAKVAGQGDMLIAGRHGCDHEAWPGFSRCGWRGRGGARRGRSRPRPDELDLDGGITSQEGAQPRGRHSARRKLSGAPMREPSGGLLARRRPRCARLPASPSSRPAVAADAPPAGRGARGASARRAGARPCGPRARAPAAAD